MAQRLVQNVLGQCLEVLRRDLTGGSSHETAEEALKCIGRYESAEYAQRKLKTRADLERRVHKRDAG